jgi:predicted DCC family thiol-disulfide oxidoreductase YuxK
VRPAYAGHVLVYDRDCGFCVRSVRWARRLGATCAAQAWQDTDLPAAGLTEQQVLEAAWYVDGEHRFRGHEAVAYTLRSSRYGVVRLLGRLIGSRALQRPAGTAYSWVARNRYRLPGASDACQLD